ncbi:MAG: sigma-54 dependent transcriptional regulator [Proteobacteria bacterium]|nr:sigma-54 dependent transcriptional regulator [Pseudomonadota bacterium]
MTERKTRILFVDDEAAWRRIFCRELRDDPRFTIQTAGSGEEALRILEDFRAEIVLTDLSMPGMDGVALLQKIHARYPDLFVLILTGVDSTSEAVRAMKAGAYDYILKPFDATSLQMQLEKILRHRRLLHGDHPDRGEEAQFENLIGQEPAMYELFEFIRRIAATDATVLIRGESGSGKELIAAAIHNRSKRRDQVFLPVNCAALSEGLIGSTLFGHEKGAFTGADRQKIGLFERADGGTIFLDEIGDIPMATQLSLLRVLELGTFQRVGGTETLGADTRIICATNKDLEAAIGAKTFREDLYYRLNVVTLRAPPLRERPADVPLLAQYFLRKFSRDHQKPVAAISPAAMSLLNANPWPGNVRELAHAIERAVIFCRGVELRPEDLPAELRQAPPANAFNLTLTSSALTEIEADVIRKVLEDTQWNMSRAAEALGIARGTLYGKIKSYRIEKSS